MKATSYAIGFILLLLSQRAFAYFSTPENSCTPVDFRQSFPLKMRNQGEVSWCFAHAAADYLQYSYQLPEQISAADIAINYGHSNLSKIVNTLSHVMVANDRGRPPETGFITKAVTMIKSIGYCPEAALPSDHWTKVDTVTGIRSEVPILPAILSLFDLHKKFRLNPVSSPDSLPWYFEFSNINKIQFFELLKTKKRAHLLETLRTQACFNQRKPFSKVSVEQNFSLRGAHVFQKLNSSFDREMPATVDFFNDVFKNYNAKWGRGALHTVLLYGRKFDSKTGQCLYLMKNSRGQSCEGYPAELSCEQGYLWLPENKLYQSMVSEFILRKL